MESLGILEKRIAVNPQITKRGIIKPKERKSKSRNPAILRREISCFVEKIGDLMVGLLFG
jgi:hypothetical protein